MAECSNCDSGAGPFAEGRELVEFVSKVHEGSLKDQSIPEGGLDTKCQGCGEYHQDISNIQHYQKADISAISVRPLTPQKPTISR